VTDAASLQNAGVEATTAWYEYARKLEVEVERLTESLKHLSEPNWGAKPRAQDALDMVAYARAALGEQA